MEEMQMELGVAAFWLFIAACVVAGIWRQKNSEAIRHETLRQLIAKEQKLDEAQIEKLLNPTHGSGWAAFQEHSHMAPGSGYRTLRIFGSITIFLSFGLAIAAAWIRFFRGQINEDVAGAVIAASILIMIGIGLFFSSRFAPKPPKDENTDKKSNR
jgi:uncharacterized membrane protein YraQ (UPF0718 family)